MYDIPEEFLCYKRIVGLHGRGFLWTVNIQNNLKLWKNTIAKDWNAVGDMIAYPIGSEEDHTLCNNKEEFLNYANDTGFDDEMLDLLKKAGFWKN